MKKILLTGATGFIGSNLASEVLDKGHSLHIVSRRQNCAILEFEKRGAKISTCELDDLPELKNCTKDIDIIIHLAGATRTLTEKEMFNVNCQYTKNLLDVSENKDIHFIYVSSQAAAGPALSPDIPVTESDTPNPLTWYGKSKLAAEIEVKKWGSRNNNKFTILRPPSVFGPGEKDIFSCFKLMKSNLSLIMGFSRKMLSVVYVKDLVSSILHVAENIEPTGETYFVSSDLPHSWEELFSAIASSMGKQRHLTIKLPEITAYPVACFSELVARIKKEPALINSQKIIEMKQNYWVCSNALIKSTGWKPQYSLSEAMDETVDWYRKNNWL